MNQINIKPVCQNKCNYIKMLEEELKKLREENQKLKKDNLTNTWNRHYLDEMLKNEYYPKIKNGWYYNVFMIDINNLHNYNRKYGYLEGDKYIKSIILNIKNEIEKQKVSVGIYRTGGDEFLIFVQPYDELDLSSVKNITFAKEIFDYKLNFNELIDKLDKQIIKRKDK